VFDYPITCKDDKDIMSEFKVSYEQKPKTKKLQAKDKRNKFKKFIAQSKEEIEKEESGPDRLPPQDYLHKARETKEYQEKIEKAKVAK